MISIFSKNDSMKRFHLGSSTKKHILSAWETAKPRKMPNRTESRPTTTAMYLIYRLKPFKSIENPKRNDGFSPEHEKIEKKRGKQSGNLAFSAMRRYFKKSKIMLERFHIAYSTARGGGTPCLSQVVGYSFGISKNKASTISL